MTIIDLQKTAIMLDEVLDELSEEIKPILRAEQSLKFKQMRIDKYQSWSMIFLTI